MLSEESYINERLDHLGIVAGVCQEIGLAAWLDAQDPGNRCFACETDARAALERELKSKPTWLEVHVFT